MTFSKISVLVPTRDRVQRLRTLIDSYLSTGSGQVELLFRVDDDDEPSQTLLHAEGFRTVIGPRLNGYHSMPTFFNELALAADGDVLMLGNDDMVFRTPGWAQLVLATANAYPDGLFDIGVSTRDEDHYPFAIVAKAVVGWLGFMFDPRIFCGDIFLRDVMSAFGRVIPLPTVRVDHDWDGPKPPTVVLNGKTVDIAGPYWNGPHKEAVADAVARLKEMV